MLRLGGGGINRNTLALCIGTGWRLPSESHGGIIGIGTQKAAAAEEHR